MRIWGNVLLAIGILFLILLGLAELGGAHLGVAPFFIMAILILIGWKLRTSGRGILRSKSAETVPAPRQPAALAVEFSTVELPLTPEVAALIASQNARTQRILLYIVGGCLAFFAGLGAVLGAADNIPGEGRTFLLLFGGLGVACAFLIYAISWLTTQKPVRRDLRATTYLRTTGPVKVVPIVGGAMLRLADRAFLMDGRSGMVELSNLDWGCVDYSPHGHMILGAWDGEGRSVYCLPGYTVASGSRGA